MKKSRIVMALFLFVFIALQSCVLTDPHLTEAKISMGRGELQKAQQELAIVIEQQPNNVEAAYLEGYIHFKQENWAKMYDSFERTKKIDPLYEKENIDNMSMKALGTLNSSENKVGRVNDPIANEDDKNNNYNNKDRYSLNNDPDNPKNDNNINKFKNIDSHTDVKTIRDNNGPEIVLYSPRATRGIKISETNNQILINGKATDKSGIFSVQINGVEAELNENGEFQKLIKLAIGDNDIEILATDTKENISQYSFITTREQKEQFNDYSAFESKNVSEKRLALVIGNANYRKAGQQLKNPVNDANLMAQTLKDLGFEVIIQTDASKQAIEKSIKEYSRKLPNYSVTLFYHAGHGVQVDGMNYLIPIDAEIKEKNDCKFEAVPVNFVVEEFEKYPENTNIVILDACRNNPFRSWARGGNEGFRAISPSSGTIIAFATSEGATASDGTGSNGLFTQVLTKQMKKPQPVESVFKNTRNEVEKLSNYSQSPQEWTKLKGDFWFKK